MRLLGVLRNTSVVSACPASSLPSTIFPLGTHNFFILRVGSLGGADLCPSSPTYQHFPSYSQVQDFWCNPDWREERNVCSCWVCWEEGVSPELQTAILILEERTSLRMEPAEKEHRPEIETQSKNLICAPVCRHTLYSIPGIFSYMNK